MPRRIYTYEPGRGWDIWNLLVTVGVFFQGPAVAGLRGQPRPVLLPRAAGWKRPVGRLDAGVVHLLAAARLQLRVLPVVKSRRPLWDLKHPEDPDWKYE